TKNPSIHAYSYIGRVGNGMIYPVLAYRFPVLSMRVRDEEGFEGTNPLIFSWALRTSLPP
ncbi:MAG TPA: hypothetical protein VIR31_00270, partial [Nitrososphaeraceae archaeon]